MNYHLVKDPYDAVFPRDLLLRIVTFLSGSDVSKHMSKSTQEMLKMALQQGSNEEIENPLNWAHQQFVASPFCSFLPRFR